ncbi:MAG: hypothetical protein Q4F03_03110 [Eubacteriales bacterium]|nr:hypothetical protein [Eubacteriales bacterium]
MREVGGIFSVIRFNFLGFWRKPKVILTFLLGFVLCFLLSGRVIPVIETYKSPVQVTEPFLWTFGDATAILLSAVLLLLLFSDLPCLSAITPYYLYRTTKRKWLMGQLVYVLVVSALYVVFMMASTMVLCMENAYPGNVWSDTAARLAYSKLGEELSVPSTVKVMEGILPYGCTFGVILLLFLFCLTLSLVILAGNLLPGKGKGLLAGMLFCLYGFLLDPRVLRVLLGYEEYEMYKVNVLIGWISPLSHAAYARHNFGYDKLPTVGQSCLVFTGLILGLGLLCGWLIKKYHFGFLGGANE